MTEMLWGTHRGQFGSLVSFVFDMVWDTKVIFWAFFLTPGMLWRSQMIVLAVLQVSGCYEAPRWQSWLFPSCQKYHVNPGDSLGYSLYVRHALKHPGDSICVSRCTEPQDFNQKQRLQFGLIHFCLIWYGTPT